MATAPSIDRFRLTPDRLRWECDPNSLTFTATDELPPEAHIIGQDRAVRAIDFGLSVTQPGYNIFVTGPSGTGRTTYARTQIEALAARRPAPPDWCYVYNFDEPDQPLAIALPPGRGRAFKQDMAELIDELRAAIRRVFQSEDFNTRRQALVQQFEGRGNALWQEVERAARARRFLIQRGPTGIITVPLGAQGQPMAPDEFNALPPEQRDDWQRRGRELQEELGEVIRRIQALERDARESLRALERETALYAASGPLERMRERYRDQERILTFLERVQLDVIENLGAFQEDEEPSPGGPLAALMRTRRDQMRRYEVNLVVDNSGRRTAPLIVESNPSYYNLLGKIEYRAEFGAMVTDHTMIKAGALQQANGGYLLLQAKDVLVASFAYETLKRALRARQARIENLSDVLGLVPTATLRPEPIPLDVKAVLIGSPLLYHLLFAYDEDFRKLFKIKADFDVEMPRTAETMHEYARAIATICQSEGACHFDRTGIARVLEHAARLAGDQEKLSTRFNEMSEVVFEASAWATREGSRYVTEAHVRRAVDEKVYRSNRIEEKIRELIGQGTIMIDIEGAVVGQINGLEVLQLGDYVFGKPARITAQTSVGARGVVNIEREVALSGPFHSKGVAILSAFLFGRFAYDKPLSITASITFEQSYNEVDGDSASSTELYALLSELSGLPIRQGIAVTGSVNQRGQVQPIGGVNEKVEGYFATCKIKGLDSTQGVIIPVQNVRNLMLREEVVDAVASGLFHVWAVSHVDEGIEILTGVPAGEFRDGRFPPDSVNGRIDRQLREMADKLRYYGRVDGAAGGEARPPAPAVPQPPEPPLPRRDARRRRG